MQVLFEVTVPVFALIGLGYISVRRGLFSDSHIAGLMRFAQYVAIPCLLFRAISQIDFRANFDSLLMVSFYAGSLCTFLLGVLGARHACSRSWEDSIAIGFAAMFSNTVLIGLAIVGRAYGDDTLASTFLIVSIHAPFCYLIGIAVMETAKSADLDMLRTLRAVANGMFRNSIMLGIGAGFLFNILEIPVPILIGDTLDMIRLTALPAALFGLGGILVQYKPEGDIIVIAMVCMLTLIVHPLVTWLLAAKTFQLDQSLVRSAVITAAMAPGINACIFSSMYGRAMRVSATSVLVGTAASIITASAWIVLVG